MKTRGRWVVPLGLAVVGLITMCGGFAYGMVYANVPWPDWTPEEKAQWHRDSEISGMAMVVGAGIVAVAAGWFAIPGLTRLWSQAENREVL